MNKFYGAHDQWTDLDKQNDVLITSTDGVIDSVKVNGEDYGGGGSSDFSTAEVTVTNNQKENALIIDELVNADVDGLSNGIALEAGESKTISIVLYKDIPTHGYHNGAGVVAVTGDIVYEDGDFYVSGDGTITVTDEK